VDKWGINKQFYEQNDLFMKSVDQVS